MIEAHDGLPPHCHPLLLHEHSSILLLLLLGLESFLRGYWMRLLALLLARVLLTRLRLRLWLGLRLLLRSLWLLRRRRLLGLLT